MAAIGVAAALLGAIALATPAFAGAAAVENFVHCPLSDPATKDCVFSRSQYATTRWLNPLPPSTLIVGTITAPLRKNLVIQGGLTALGPFGELTPPTDGSGRLVKVAEPVLGGLRSIIDPALLSYPVRLAYERTLREHRDAVTVTIELAPAEAPLELQGLNFMHEEGTFLVLPAKVHIGNEFLGPYCYDGSDASPIPIELTDGATAPPPPLEPERGRLGQEHGFARGLALKVTEDSLVADTFAVPAVEGCGRAPAWRAQVDAAIDTTVGLPAKAGESSVRIDGTFFLASADMVRARMRELIAG